MSEPDKVPVQGATDPVVVADLMTFPDVDVGRQNPVELHRPGPVPVQPMNDGNVLTTRDSVFSFESGYEFGVRCRLFDSLGRLQ